MSAPRNSWKRNSARLLSIIFQTFQAVVHTIFRFLYGHSKARLPPIKNDILRESATSLARKIRKKQITSVQVVQAFINRIATVNSILNAVIDNRFDDALKDARNADEYISSSGKTEEELAEELPFLGVPFTTKDCIGVKGLAQTSGLLFFKGNIAEEDADVIVLMKKAGAIPFAITNVSEMCTYWESFNKIYGRTNNPYDTTRIVGGSSGGEGCLLTAAGSPMGIGSDIGGSVRIPAFFTGVFGHKPSPEVVSLKGHLTTTMDDEQKSFLSPGPMSRFATDLIPMLKVLAPGHRDILQLDAKVDIRQLKLYYQERDDSVPIVSTVEEEICEAIQKCVAYLERKHNIIAEKLGIEEFSSSLEMWFAKMASKDGPQLVRDLAGGRKDHINAYEEMMKLCIGKSNHTFPLLLAALLEIWSPIESPRCKLLAAKCDDLKRKLSDILGPNGVLIFPTHPTVAPYHGEPIFKPFNVGYTAIFNLFHMPSTHCPMGLNREGLPIGVQIIASQNNDKLTLAVARELEKAFGGWVDPSRIERFRT